MLAVPAGIWASLGEHPLVVSGLATLAATILALW
jgi:hypothetical protein